MRVRAPKLGEGRLFAESVQPCCHTMVLLCLFVSMLHSNKIGDKLGFRALFLSVYKNKFTVS